MNLIILKVFCHLIIKKRKAKKTWSEDMAQLVKALFLQKEHLNLLLRTHIKKPSMVALAWEFQCWGGKGRLTPGVCKLVYLIYLENPRPVRDPALKNKLMVPEEWSSKLSFVFHIHMYTHIYEHVHTYTYKEKRKFEY